MSEVTKGFPVFPGQPVPHEDWDRAPWNRWTFQNVREMVPTTEVWRGNGPVWALEQNPQDLGNIEFENAAGQNSTLQQWIDTSYTDGILVLHKGAILLEQYHNNMDERTLHLSQSMAKSVVTSSIHPVVGCDAPLISKG